MIYFIKCGEFVKIGKTRNPSERLSSFQTGNPYEVTIIGTLDAPDDEESRLHSAFASFHHKREWFFLSKTISDFIDRHCDRPESQSVDEPKKQAPQMVSNVVWLLSKRNRNKDRNLEVVRLYEEGKHDREIADTVGLSERHVRRIRLLYVPVSSSSRDSVT